MGTPGFLKNIKRALVLALFSSVFSNAKGQGKIYKLSSPDNSTSIEITSIDSKLKYRIFAYQHEIITWSSLGLETKSSSDEKLTIRASTEKKIRGEFLWPLGEDDHISNSYNENRFACKGRFSHFSLIARVYNGSVAFRYELPESAKAKRIRKEMTEFNFTENYTLYQYHQETVFTPVSIDTFTMSSDLPTTLANSSFYVSVGEANNDNYTKAELKRSAVAHGLAIAFFRDTAVTASGNFYTPWRTVSISKTAIGLHDFSQLNLKLNPPSASGIPPWIRPGKLIRSQLNTQSGLDCIDFAVKHNFQYIMFDAGWYGAEFRTTSDPTQVIPQIDMPKVIQYGKEKGIGVILYVNYVGLRAKLDTILPLFKKWGVAGMKFGFVDGLTQNGIKWLADAIRKVNDYGFILDIHDNYKPTGLSRTFPALLTQEGIRGDENSPDAFHTTTLPFTRFLTGPADFTFCYPNAKEKFARNLKVSMGQQLALTVIYFSPLQSIFWYGKPNDYINEDEIEFFKYVPTVWNESHYIAGEIGKNISVARRKTDTWYMGNATGLDDWQTTIRLDFLTKGKVYSATVYEDDNKGSIAKRSLHVKKGDLFSISLKAKAGQAIIIKPIITKSTLMSEMNKIIN